MAIMPASLTLDYDVRWIKEYENDFEYIHTNYDELRSKHKNEFVAVKNLQVYHDPDPLNLLEQLMADVVDDTYNASIGF